MEKGLSTGTAIASREDIEDHFEQIWTKDKNCACARSGASREAMLLMASEEAVALHISLSENGICPLMMTRMIGLVAAAAIAINENISQGVKEPPVLFRTPGLAALLEEARAAAVHAIKAAGEVGGTC